MDSEDKELFESIKVLPLGSKLELMNKIVSSICKDGEVKTIENRFEQIRSATESVFGRAIDRSRVRENVIAKSFIAYIMRNEGFSTTKIGRMLHLHHATILYLTNKVKDMLSLPWIYAEDLEKLNQIIELLDENKIQEADGECGDSVEGASV